MSDGATARPVEVELKYRLRDLAAGERYLVADTIGPFLPAGGTQTTQIEDRYLDTADRALARAGFAARLRQSRRGTVVTVKSTAAREAGTGPYRREELEGLADRTLGPRDWPPSGARSLILELCGDAPLVELVTMRQLRRQRELRDGDAAVELSLDEVDVVVRSQVVDRFLELEVELLRGDDARLVALGEALAADPALGEARGSKLEAALSAIRVHDEAGPADDDPADAAVDVPRVARAARAAKDAPAIADAPATPTPEAAAAPSAEPEPQLAAAVPAPVASPTRAETPSPAGEAERPLAVGRTPGVTADDHVAEAGRKILRFHLARMIAREPGTRSGDDPEDLHSMRVATRRMRAAWRVFGDGFRPERTRRYRNRLREVAGRLGAVRDLDVLLEAAEAYRSDLPKAEQKALEPLLAAWRRYREDARTLLLHALDSPGYARFVEDFRVFVQTDGAAVLPVVPTQPHRIRDTAPSRIWSAYQQVRAYEPVLRWADVETLHDLRIAAKWLRYTLEFVREALGPEVGPLVARVTALQDHLGWLHDADVAAGMARTFLVEHAGSLSTAESAAIGKYLVSREREVARLRRTVGAPWGGVAGLGFRRGLGRTVAGL
jgi:CHAD domain-containing protein